MRVPGHHDHDHHVRDVLWRLKPVASGRCRGGHRKHCNMDGISVEHIRGNVRNSFGLQVPRPLSHVGGCDLKDLQPLALRFIRHAIVPAVVQ